MSSSPSSPGRTSAATGDLLDALYSGIDAPLIRTDIEVAEMLKYADNAWHAVKIGFANEIGYDCKRLGIDSHQVMDIVCLDTKLNNLSDLSQPGVCLRRLLSAQRPQGSDR